MRVGDRELIDRVGVAALPLGMRAVELGVDERDQRAVGVDRRGRQRGVDDPVAPVVRRHRQRVLGDRPLQRLGQRVGLGVGEQAPERARRRRGRAGGRPRSRRCRRGRCARRRSGAPRPRARAPGRAPTIHVPRAAGAEAATASPGSAIGGSGASAIAGGAASAAMPAPHASARQRKAFTPLRLVAHRCAPLEAGAAPGASDRRRTPPAGRGARRARGRGRSGRPRRAARAGG